MGFNFTLNVENLGNIKKAQINVKPLTMIAGENSSGKTFITKSLYTVLNSLAIPHFPVHLEKNISNFTFHFRHFIDAFSNPARDDYDFFEYIEESIENLENISLALSKSTISEQEKQIKSYLEELYITNNVIDEYIKRRSSVQRFQKILDTVEDFKEAFNEIIKTSQNFIETIVNNIAITLSDGLKNNFQITNLDLLINNKQSKSTKIDISTLGNVEIKSNTPLLFNFTATGITEVRKLSHIIFFDSPIYMKIRKALETLNRQRRFSSFSANNQYLKGYPEYIEELFQYSNKEYIGIPTFDNVSKEIQKAIGGKLIVSKGGEVIYKDIDNNEIPLSLTAMGIGNIGTIELLIRNNIINEGSFLIMDEPEVHLHPEWQVKLANILYELAKNNVNIIIATHSLDFLKAFQVICENNEEKTEDIIAFNKMPFKKEFSKKSELEKVNEILDDLSKPFYHLYMQDI